MPRSGSWQTKQNRRDPRGKQELTREDRNNQPRSGPNTQYPIPMHQRPQSSLPLPRLTDAQTIDTRHSRNALIRTNTGSPSQLISTDLDAGIVEQRDKQVDDTYLAHSRTSPPGFSGKLERLNVNLVTA